MSRSSTTYAPRVLAIAAAVVGLLAATGCSSTVSDARLASASNLDNPIHTRVDTLHIASESPANPGAPLPSESRGAPGRWGHAFASPR